MPKSKTAVVKVYGPKEHNGAFALAIGQLVISWANNESLFLAILQALLARSDKSAPIVWHSHRTTRNRVQMVRALAIERISDDGLIERLDAAIKHFHKLSKMRNFLCHAMYDYDLNLHLKSATASNSDNSFTTEIRSMNAATLNEIQNTTALLHEFNAQMWELVRAIDEHLGVERSDKYPERGNPSR